MTTLSRGAHSLPGGPPARHRSTRVELARRAAHVTERLSRATGRGSGGVIGGRVLLGLAPRAARELSAGRHVSLVSGTNGKTTTTAYLTACLRLLGPVASNADGANTRAGLVRALAADDADRVVCETDEGWLPWTVAETSPALALLLNLSRDQLHRHHEVAHVAAAWREAMPGVGHVVANVDDPAVVTAALAAPGQTWVALGSRWVDDSRVCPRCGDSCRRDGEDWSCAACGLHRPTPQWWLEGDDLVTAGVRLPLGLALPGDANRANALAAVAAAVRLGVPPARAVAAVREIADVAGRYGLVEHSHHRVRLLLAKNPASWLEALATVAGSGCPVVLAFNSEGVDGRDPSWLYDVDFTALRGRRVTVTGRRATDMLVRLEMAGLTDLHEAPDLSSAIAGQPADTVEMVANYTAFQEARRLLLPWRASRP